MTLRAIKERKNVVNVENDLRGLGSVVQERPPHYELRFTLVEGKSHLVEKLATLRGMTERVTLHHGPILTTPESIPHHEQAVWHFFMLAELLQHDLIKSAEICLVHPLEGMLLNEKSPELHSAPRGPSSIRIDASVALFMMKAGHWHKHFPSNHSIHKDIKASGRVMIDLDRGFVHTLMQDIKASIQSEKTEGLRHAK